MRRLMAVMVVAVLVGSCSVEPDAPSSGSTAESWEYKLAALHGDPSTEAEFGQILDAISQGSSTCAPEPDRQKASDAIYASWEQSSQQDSLLEWARVLRDFCS